MSGLNELVGNFPYMGLFILLILGAIGFPFPEGITLIICGFLIFNNVIEPLPAIMAAYSGILIGDLIAYSIGRKYGRMVVTHKRFQWIISTAQLSRLENKFNKKGMVGLQSNEKRISFSCPGLANH